MVLGLGKVSIFSTMESIMLHITCSWTSFGRICVGCLQRQFLVVCQGFTFYILVIAKFARRRPRFGRRAIRMIGNIATTIFHSTRKGMSRTTGDNWISRRYISKGYSAVNAVITAKKIIIYAFEGPR
jgi:hypothetical protein